MDGGPVGVCEGDAEGALDGGPVGVCEGDAEGVLDGTAVLGVAVLGTAVLHSQNGSSNPALGTAGRLFHKRSITEHAGANPPHVELTIGPARMANLGVAVLGTTVLGTGVLGVAVVGTVVLGVAVLGTAVLHRATRLIQPSIG